MQNNGDDFAHSSLICSANLKYFRVVSNAAQISAYPELSPVVLDNHSRLQEITRGFKTLKGNFQTRVRFFQILMD
jgi:hypothetical protein